MSSFSATGRDFTCLQRTIRCKTLYVLIYVLALGTANNFSAGQALQVATISHVVLYTGNPPSDIDLTKFHEVLIGSSGRSTFIVRNPAPTGNLIINSFANTPPFNLDLSQTLMTVPPLGSTTFDVVFAPATAGEVTGNITVSTNVLTDFNFQVSGTGVHTLFHTPTPDLHIILVKPLKVKRVRSNGLLTLTAKVQVTNLGDADAADPVVMALPATGGYLAFPVPVLTSARVKPLPASSGGKIRKAKVRIRIDDVANVSGSIFFNAGSAPDYTDMDFADNIAYGDYEAVP